MADPQMLESNIEDSRKGRPGYSDFDCLGHYGGLFWRFHTFHEAGDEHAGHRHRIDHATILARGGVRVEIAGEDAREVWAPAVIPIDKDKYHRITALEAGTAYYCVFATNDPSYTDHDYGSMYDGMSVEERKAAYAKVFCGSCTGCGGWSDGMLDAYFTALANEGAPPR
jgi:hypothetical protein